MAAPHRQPTTTTGPRTRAGHVDNDDESMRSTRKMDTTTGLRRRQAYEDVLRRGLRIDDNGHLSSLSSLEKPPHSVSSLRISKGVPAFRRRRIPAIDVDVVVADKSKWTWVSCSKCLALKVKSVTSMGKKEI
ncbi:hypothetical protein D9611_012093 [Ephemerocybe angulata]|uniref:Uncharacterized protein n=1 Tax=Ephemerocybe angulata TaxID=980116 RepID=A0A8H5AUI9_9AGAR|nr:hypothetical protein D9611_012093 [Tulosesus angulatus]